MDTRIRKSALVGAIILGAFALPAGAAFASPVVSQTSSPSATASSSSTATSTTTTTSTATTTASATGTSTSSPTSTATTQASPSASPTKTASATPTHSASASPSASGTATAETPAPGGVTQPADSPFHATLTGAAQIPPVQTNDTGEFSATQEGLGVAFTLTAHGSALTMAHIHVGAPGTNGPIVVTLYMAPGTSGVSDINLSGAISPSMLQGAYAGKFQQFIDDMKAGKFYVNVHSVDHPDGIIRGQVQYTAPAPPNAPATGSGVVTKGSSSMAWMLLGAGAIVVIGALGGWVTLRRSA